jgi:threonine/homoserine/homoserine lactone efflux protein
MTTQTGNAVLATVRSTVLFVLFCALAIIFAVISFLSAILLTKSGLKFLLEWETAKKESTAENPVGFLAALMKVVRDKVAAFVSSEATEEAPAPTATEEAPQSEATATGFEGTISVLATGVLSGAASAASVLKNNVQ